jgi:uncharacterized protein YecE (DUF72 family)
MSTTTQGNTKNPESHVSARSVFVGTSGWHYKHWLGTFYAARLPARQMLSFYAEHFDTVELNTTFYRLPPPNAAAEWKKMTPPNFCFAAKGSRFLTHMKKLRDAETGVERFFDRIRGLGKKLGPVVFQLPPQWPVNEKRLEEFLDILPGRRRYAFEFRNPTWNNGTVYRLLTKHNAALCMFDLAGMQSPVALTADHTYIRLHGPGGKYQGSYSDDALKLWANRIQNWGLAASYIYFDNDQAGYAPKNAARLREILGQ